MKFQKAVVNIAENQEAICETLVSQSLLSPDQDCLLNAMRAAGFGVMITIEIQVEPPIDYAAKLVGV